MGSKASVLLRGQSLMHAVVFMLAVHLMVDNVSGGTWWSLGVTTCGLRNTGGSGSSVCPSCASLLKDTILTQHQEESCRDQPSVIESISRGARHAIIDCQRRFQHSRWNCSTLYGDYLFGKFVSQSYTRETALLTSYFIAGAIWGIASDCHDQRIPGCACNRSMKGGKDESGSLILTDCDADVSYARTYIQDFLINAIPSDTLQGEIEKHNINIGEMITGDREPVCRCHGISGTCSVQTCYLRTEEVKDIGQALFDMYGGAQKVDSIVQVDTGIQAFAYIKDSPDFCVRNDSLGTTGVALRDCKPNSNEPNACATLCCGYGYQTVTKIVPKEECKFVWCCRIECNPIGNVTITEHRCNAAQ